MRCKSAPFQDIYDIRVGILREGGALARVIHQLHRKGPPVVNRPAELRRDPWDVNTNLHLVGFPSAKLVNRSTQLAMHRSGPGLSVSKCERLPASRLLTGAEMTFNKDPSQGASQPA